MRFNLHGVVMQFQHGLNGKRTTDMFVVGTRGSIRHFPEHSRENSDCECLYACVYYIVCVNKDH